MSSSSLLCLMLFFYFSILTEEKCTTAKRGPLRNEDCYWDYGKARCAWAEYCEYRLSLHLNYFLVGSTRLHVSSSSFLSYDILVMQIRVWGCSLGTEL